MRRLLGANLERLKKNKVFYACLIVSVFYCVLVCVSIWRDTIRFDVTMSVDDALFNFMVSIGLIISLFCSLFIGTEYSDGTIRNKIVVGHVRYQIYLSYFLICTLMGAVLYVFCLLAGFVLGIPLLGGVETELPYLLCLLLDALLVCIVYGAIFNLIAVLSSNKAHTAVLCILAALVLMVIGIYLYQTLQQPETISQLVGTGEDMEISIEGADGMDFALETVKNPHYVSGLRREIYQFFLDFLPSGQVMQIGSRTALHPYLMGVYSMIIIVVSNLAGMFFFEKKDIK